MAIEGRRQYLDGSDTPAQGADWLTFSVPVALIGSIEFSSKKAPFDFKVPGQKSVESNGVGGFKRSGLKQ